MLNARWNKNRGTIASAVSALRACLFSSAIVGSRRKPPFRILPPVYAGLLVCLSVQPPDLCAADRLSLQDCLRRPAEWFKSEEAQRFGTNILSFQSEPGGWPKNKDTFSQPYHGKRPETDLKPTFDNGATVNELRFLARVFRATENSLFKEGFEKGYRYILKAQYPNGGWPQSYPAQPGHYERRITFNDGAMVRVMDFLRESYSSQAYDFLPSDQLREAREAFDHGIDCILRCQIKVDGKLTAWCAQHDEKDFSPQPARAYELVSLSGSESVGIVRLLMSLEQPSPRVVTAVKAAVKWFETVRLPGIREVRLPDVNAPRGLDKRIIEDPGAPPMWARFYEIGTNLPIFCDRDGVPKRKLSEIGYERRNGYAWLGYWPKDLLEKEYPEWHKKRQGE